MTFVINFNKKSGKFRKMWRLNNMLLSNQWFNKELKKEIQMS